MGKIGRDSDTFRTQTGVEWRRTWLPDEQRYEWATACRRGIAGRNEGLATCFGSRDGQIVGREFKSLKDAMLQAGRGLY